MKNFIVFAFIFYVADAGAQLLTVHFDFDRAELTNATIASIDSFIQVNDSCQNLKIRLSGHCDSIGEDIYNDQLSIRRAEAVKEYMLKQGVPFSTFTEKKGYGEKQPLNNNTTEENRWLNRRVEIHYRLTKLEYALNTTTLKEKIAADDVIEGTSIALKNINFFGGKHQMVPESFPALVELRDAMLYYPGLVVQIDGHICCIPGTSDGPDIETGIINLSEARAKAVRDYLVFRVGIDSSRVTYQGFGHSRPIYPYPEATQEQMLENRRVEIKIIRK